MKLIAAFISVLALGLIVACNEYKQIPSNSQPEDYEKLVVVKVFDDVVYSSDELIPPEELAHILSEICATQTNLIKQETKDKVRYRVTLNLELHYTMTKSSRVVFSSSAYAYLQCDERSCDFAVANDPNIDPPIEIYRTIDDAMNGLSEYCDDLFVTWWQQTNLAEQAAPSNR